MQPQPTGGLRTGGRMTTLVHLAGAFAAAALLIHVATAACALWRCRRRRVWHSPAAPTPSVTVIRPVCGLDPHEEATLRSTFELDYPSYEALFCCASPGDPVVPLLERLIAEHPGVRARLLIGEDRISSNPKLNNLVKGWRAAAHAWIAIADSNVLMPRDYLQRLLATWRPDTGLVSAPPIGAMPEGIWAELEAAFLNTYQARWQFAADSLGLGFTQGKNMLWRRSDLECAGGLQVLGAEVAEDAAATNVVRGLGLRVRLADGAFPQPLGRRTAGQIWARQLRWARLRRSTFPGFFLLELISGALAPLLAAVFAAAALDIDPASTGAMFMAVWLAAEAALAVGAGWHLTWRSPLLWLARDLLLPVLWMQCWLGKELSWRGTAMSIAKDEAVASGQL